MTFRMPGIEEGLRPDHFRRKKFGAKTQRTKSARRKVIDLPHIGRQSRARYSPLFSFQSLGPRPMASYAKVRLTLAFMLGVLGLCVCCSVARGQQPATQSAHFHHLHLNTPDPAAAIKFYTSKFACEEARFLGHDAAGAQQSWLLFNKVKSAPPWELTSAIWHFGWGAEDMKAAYQKQLEMGTKFFTPL